MRTEDLILFGFHFVLIPSSILIFMYLEKSIFSLLLYFDIFTQHIFNQFSYFSAVFFGLGVAEAIININRMSTPFASADIFCN